MYQINIDGEVLECLKRLAIPFKDHEPNDVLRRILKLGGTEEIKISQQEGTGLGRKRRGMLKRKEYVSELEQKGLHIKLMGGVWGKLADDSQVAIPFASEGKPGRWFLGLPENDLREKDRVTITLLCQDKSGNTFDIVIPPDVVKDLPDKLSKSKGQVKFHLWKIGDHYQIMIPRSEPLDVSDYFNNHTLFN